MNNTTLLSAFNNKDSELISKAIDLAKNKLNNKYFSHAIETTELLADKGLAKETIIAAILHDTIYENALTYDEIKNNFGEEVAGVVREISIINNVVKTNFPKIGSETLSSIILSISSDIQTIIIQIAELTNILEKKELTKDYGKTLIPLIKEVYVPLSLKLGLGRTNWKLEDDCFKLENPSAYSKIKKLVNKTREEREKIISEVKEEVEDLFKGKSDVQLTGRPKNFYSIYKKMKKVPFKQINDLYGMRLLCNKERDCYEVLGRIHSKYPLLPDAFDDYISKPKATGYKSIHTAVKRGQDIIEFQIRTWEQHLRIESNLYWEYKKLKQNRDFEKNLSWERQLVEWQKSIGQDTEKRRVISKKIYVFTPKNEVVSLPIGATVIDFAFAIHTEIGLKMKQTKINNKIAPLESELKNLDRIEIITDKKNQIKETWLNYVKTEKAKTKIKQYFGIKAVLKRKSVLGLKTIQKIKLAECCKPLPGEDVIGVKTTKRKIIIHKINCTNVKNVSKEKLVEITLENNQGKTKLLVTGTDRVGLLGEILNEIKKSSSKITKTNFNIKKSGYVEAEFDIEINNIKKLEKLMEKIASIPSIQSVERR